jgi:hypothetical protein
MLSLSYKDPYLMSLVTQTNEDDAIADVATYGTFTDAQGESLAVLRAYIRCCIDSVKAPDDIFATKKKMYEAELKTALEIAKSTVVSGVTPSIFSIPIERA